MYILCDPNNEIDSLRSEYLVMELDTFQFEDGRKIPTYGIIDGSKVVLEEIPVLDNLVSLHEKLIENYRKRNWSFCEQALEHLIGKFGGELDSYYNDLSGRIGELKEIDLDENWISNIQIKTDGSE